MIVFDLDGTLADISHRRHLVEKKSRTGHAPNWEAFFAACVDDKPIMPVVRLLRTCVRDGRVVEVWSGRSSAVRDQTVRWLNQHVFEQFSLNSMPVHLQMRSEGDTRPDEVLKEEWLDKSPMHVELVIDDRDKVVAMWRRRGIVCLQAAPGDF